MQKNSDAEDFHESRSVVHDERAHSGALTAQLEDALDHLARYQLRSTGAVAAQLQDGLDLATQGVVLVDQKGRISAINLEALRLLHCANSAVCGQNFWDAVPDEVAEQHMAQTRQMVAELGHYSFRAYLGFEDQWLEYSFTRHADAFVVNLTDVTAIQKLQLALERSERYNQLLFSCNPNAMWIFDLLSLQVVAVNDAATAFYGITRKSFLRLKMGALFPDGEGSSLLSSLGPSSEPAEAQLTPQICKQRKGDGQLVLVELAYGPVLWRNHHAVLVNITDVTERHLADRALRRENMELENALASTTAELENKNRDLAAFTYALSNDLQGPLHTADGFASMLAEKYSAALEGPGLHYIKRIQASTRQLAGLVDDLRELVQLPQLLGAPESLNLSNLCDVLVGDLQGRHPAQRLTFEMAPGLKLTADRHLVTTALAHLLDNAWKFTSRKSESWIKVHLFVGDHLHERVLQISDNGPGFDSAYIGKLFNAFQRLHSSVEFPGNGLGLAIVKRVADRHGGKVWAETSSTGASFFMSFPRGGGPADENPQVATSEVQSTLKR